MSTYLSADLRQALLEADGQQCAYCQTSTDNTGQPMTVDHIIPSAQGGLTEFENLCFCCRACNEYKGATIAAIDPLTGEAGSFFNPRQQNWREHFQWDEMGTQLVGLTITGRITIVGLNMNNPVIISARRRWVSVGWHPPQ